MTLSLGLLFVERECVSGRRNYFSVKVQRDPRPRGQRGCLRAKCLQIARPQLVAQLSVSLHRGHFLIACSFGGTAPENADMENRIASGQTPRGYFICAQSSRILLFGVMEMTLNCPGQTKREDCSLCGCSVVELRHVCH